jgi:hypothetical protein
MRGNRRDFLGALGRAVVAGLLPQTVNSTPPRASLAVSVKDAPYNAAGDGKTDDRNAIQRAIDDAQSGGYVFFPAGRYLLSDSLVLSDGVNLIGAGMYSAILQLAPSVNAPVLTDASLGKPGSYAFGRVFLKNLGIDGGVATVTPLDPNDTTARGAGISTTAYYSTFDNLAIENCRTDGIHVAQENLKNLASQNRIVGCRIQACGRAGVFLDINAVDHVISENYIHNVPYGIVTHNGGCRITTNDIFGTKFAGISIRQTPIALIIANNDLNANAQNGIQIERTGDATSGAWGQILITGNSLSADGQSADNQYDAIVANTDVPNGIAELTIVGNKISAYQSGHSFRYGINFNANVTRSRCAGNHIQSTGTAPYHLGPGCSHIEIDSYSGFPIATPPMIASGKDLINPFSVPATVYITGSSVTNIFVNGTPLGLKSGAIRLPANGTLRLNYQTPPTWVWIAD